MIDENKLIEDLEKIKKMCYESYQNSKDTDFDEYNTIMKTLEVVSKLIENQPKFEDLFTQPEKLFEEIDEETYEKLKEEIKKERENTEKEFKKFNEYNLERLRHRVEHKKLPRPKYFVEDFYNSPWLDKNAFYWDDKDKCYYEK